MAAVIGRDFDAACTSASSPLGEDEYLNALDEALSAGLVVETGSDAGATRSRTR